MAGPPAYQPFARQLVTAKEMNVGDSARVMALVAVGLNDALIAVFDAKYHYNFWRPITAIRNGDIDNNPATDREATWQPIDNTPMHPEYPCAHCILSGTVAGIIKPEFGTVDIPHIAVTSATAPGAPAMSSPRLVLPASSSSPMGRWDRRLCSRSRSCATRRPMGSRTSNWRWSRPCSANGRARTRAPPSRRRSPSSSYPLASFDFVEQRRQWKRRSAASEPCNCHTRIVF